MIFSQEKETYPSNESYLKVEGRIGQNIKKFAEEMVVLGLQKEKVVKGTFNGVEIMISPKFPTNAEAIVKFYNDELARKSEEYMLSPEGIEAAQKNEDEVASLQEKGDILIKDLEKLDFTDYESVLEWFCDFQEAGDRIGTSFDSGKIVYIFINNEYEIGMNTGDDFDGSDAENFAKYIVGQGLDGIQQVGAPHPVINRFVDEWKNKFGRDKMTIKKLKENL